MAHNSIWERNTQAICKEFYVHIHFIATSHSRSPPVRHNAFRKVHFERFSAISADRLFCMPQYSTKMRGRCKQ